MEKYRRNWNSASAIFHERRQLTKLQQLQQENCSQGANFWVATYLKQIMLTWPKRCTSSLTSWVDNTLLFSSSYYYYDSFAEILRELSRFGTKEMPVSICKMSPACFSFRFGLRSCSHVRVCLWPIGSTSSRNSELINLKLYIVKQSSVYAVLVSWFDCFFTSLRSATGVASNQGPKPAVPKWNIWRRLNAWLS